jgi:hypothetical protein
MQPIPDESPVAPSVARGFMVLVVFFLGLLIFELLSGETLGVPAKRSEQLLKYWIVLAVQAGAGLLFVALLYFLTH